MHTHLSLPLLLALLVGGGAAYGPDARAQRVAATVDSTESVVEYTGTAPLHRWTGTSRAVSGQFVLNPDVPDSSRAVIRVPVASFDSGNDRRDRGMREVTEADQYPVVEFRGTEFSPLLWGRGADGLVGRWEVTGELTFHGRTRSVDNTVEVRVDGDTVRARAQFPVSLTRFDVERPGFMGFTVGDTIRLDARIRGEVKE